jgi:hypothetical protein
MIPEPLPRGQTLKRLSKYFSTNGRLAHNLESSYANL